MFSFRHEKFFLFTVRCHLNIWSTFSNFRNVMLSYLQLLKQLLTRGLGLRQKTANALLNCELLQNRYMSTVYITETYTSDMAQKFQLFYKIQIW